MDIALTFALARATAACQAPACLGACRALGLDGTVIAQRSYPWTRWDRIAQHRSQASRCHRGLACRRSPWLTLGYRPHFAIASDFGMPFGKHLEARCSPHSRSRLHGSPTLLPLDWFGLACTAPLVGVAGGVRRVGASWRCCRPLSCPVNCIGGQPVLVGVWGGLATWPGSHRGVHWRRCGVMDWLWSLPLVGDDDRPHPRLALGPAPAGCRLPGLFVPRCPPHSRPRWHKESPTLLPMDWLGLACTAPLAGGAVMSWTGWDAPRGR